MEGLWSAAAVRHLEYLVADLRLYLVEKRMRALAEELAEDLRRKYRPDQPRAPEGTPEGGQWVRVDGPLEEERTRTALSAVLRLQRVGLGDSGLIRHCIYQDMLGRQRTLELDATKICPPTIPAAPWDGPL